MKQVFHIDKFPAVLSPIVPLFALTIFFGNVEFKSSKGTMEQLCATTSVSGIESCEVLVPTPHGRDCFLSVKLQSAHLRRRPLCGDHTSSVKGLAETNAILTLDPAFAPALVSSLDLL